MTVYIGADHRGFRLKEYLKDVLIKNEIDVVDVGAYELDPGDDYVVFGERVAKEVIGDKNGVGVAICGSGHGMSVVVNRFKEVRGVLGFNLDVVKQGRRDEDANVLVLPADWVSDDEAWEMVDSFLKTEFSHADRHVRRVGMLDRIGD